MEERLYSITELARELGVSPRAIRLYEAKGLLRPQRVAGTRVYTRRDRGRLKLILRGKRLGFSLAEIGEYLALYDVDPSRVRQLEALLGGVRRRITQLERQREDLELTLEELREIEREAEAELARRREQAPAARAS
ncbi:DNA-binding transcriptional MerR regulator [Inmirania thermothiophila]|uniref:DNA-binding transcriptional MerR regulator n=1 Tax=Inmirania thermothiophila TaxID=1750597 RepID=A0A3N1Y6E0_9GAMM|nr:DNA-binding transcriptional MerR regulator [Inmirania thermothiophila]